MDHFTASPSKGKSTRAQQRDVLNRNTSAKRLGKCVRGPNNMGMMHDSTRGAVKTDRNAHAPALWGQGRGS